ncbi:hypothetical protein SAMN02990966_04634 [Rhodospirillales bacterium URHD0017]|nr:hypothetical protein SAMN02990966_04634 [Rhodospirillales bacterium URHD0017]
MLQRQATQILERRFQSAGNGIADVARNQYAASNGFAFQPRRHVDTVAIKVVAIDNEVSEVQPHTEHKCSICNCVAVGLGHGLLELDGCAQRIDRTREFN